MTGTRAKTVSESRIEISQLMRPQHANFAGNVHGGVLLALMDEVAYLCATRFAEAYTVTVSAEHVDFLTAVRVGAMLTLRAAVNAVGRTSMEVGISILTEDPQVPGSSRRATRSFFTMVALDKDGRPSEVPRLVCESPEDRKWQCEAELRRELRRRYRRDLEAGVCQFEGAPIAPASG